jgi:hypothetical protein
MESSQEVRVVLPPFHCAFCNILQSTDVMLRLIYMLQLTGQFPAEKQVIETGVKWPVRLHKRKSPFDMVR